MASSSLPEDYPIRSFMDDPNIEWRFGAKPDYTKANDKFMREKSRKHKAGSLEKTVEDLVKTWEMEASHKPNPKDWGSVNIDKYHISANGGRKYTMQETVRVGTYNMLMSETPMYDAANQTFESSHHLFRTCMPDGFPWEVLEVFAGPPKVAFSFRHWSHFTGPYKDKKPTGELIEMFGFIVATVDEKLKIDELEVWYDPNPFMAKLQHIKPSSCPVLAPKAAKSP